MNVFRMSIASLLLLASIGSTAAQNFMIEMEQFDQWIFGSSGDEKQTRAMIDARAELEIIRVEQSTPLRESQKEKVMLASRGDVHRFFIKVNRVRAAFRDLQADLNQNNINEAYQLAMPLQQEINKGIFGEKSLTAKTINAILDASQRTELEEGRSRLAKRERLGLAKAWVATLGRSIPMTSEQRTQLLDVVVANVGTSRVEGQYVQYLIGYRLSQVPEDEIEPIFDETQWRLIKKSLQQAKAYKGMLEQQGVLNDE
ncbi:hypothetical protein Poly51_51020 [Rubripirellula tenax]|uniref:PpiC domain-containing protein n=1 Tax=Rubripirellula tenax TaxID=2528015 RepID=A0A5C6EE45_9BACT|nr:hypothetical protein [Rubripirellula tenax]TWU47302.1 hypothetical protein Poly51_51020 [Rubripirellula tenax]